MRRNAAATSPDWALMATAESHASELASYADREHPADRAGEK